MKRIIIICEGQTEQSFCNNNLQSIFMHREMQIQTTLIKHSKGGIVKWIFLKQQIENHLKTDKSAFVTTLIDYYGINSKLDFPNWDISKKIQDKNKIVELIENAMYEDIAEDFRFWFIPYIQLHEFEGLLFSDIDVFYKHIPPNDIINKEELENTFHEYTNPEMINNNTTTTPSKRLTRIIRGYNKIIYGDFLVSAIGIVKIREKAPRFNSWLTKLENL